MADGWLRLDLIDWVCFGNVQLGFRNDKLIFRNLKHDCYCVFVFFIIYSITNSVLALINLAIFRTLEAFIIQCHALTSFTSFSFF